MTNLVWSAMACGMSRAGLLQYTPPSGDSAAADVVMDVMKRKQALELAGIAGFAGTYPDKKNGFLLSWKGWHKVGPSETAAPYAHVLSSWSPVWMSYGAN